MTSKQVRNKRGGAWDPEQLQGKQLASLLGVTPPTVTQWHRDRGCPRNSNGSYSLADVFSWLRGNQLDLDHVRQVDILQVVGCSKTTLREWEDRGCPRNDDAHRTYSVRAVVQWRQAELESRVDDAKRASEMEIAKLRKTSAEADLAVLRAAERRGEVVPRERVVAALVSRAQTLRQSIQAVVSQAESQGVPPEHVATVQQLLESSLRRYASGSVELGLTPNQQDRLTELLSEITGRPAPDEQEPTP